MVPRMETTAMAIRSPIVSFTEVKKDFIFRNPSGPGEINYGFSEFPDTQFSRNQRGGQIKFLGRERRIKPLIEPVEATAQLTLPFPKG